MYEVQHLQNADSDGADHPCAMGHFEAPLDAVDPKVQAERCRTGLTITEAAEPMASSGAATAATEAAPEPPPDGSGPRGI